MLRFLKLAKRPPNNQSPGSIPGYLFRDEREDDGFVIVGENDPNEIKEGFHLDYGIRPDMGTAVSSIEASENCVHIEVQSADSAINNVNNMPHKLSVDNYSVNTVPAAHHWTDNSKTAHDKLNSATVNDISSDCENFADCWRDIPFQISDKYFLPPLEDVNLGNISPVKWADFHYDFHTERACFNSPVF